MEGRLQKFKITPAIEDARIRKARRDCPSKVYSPQGLIQKALEEHPGSVVVSWSGGRCSTAVLHMALQENRDIPVLHLDTGVHFPETRRFVEKIAQEWKLNLHVVKPEPGVTFWSCVKKYGFPMLRGKYGDPGYKRSKDGKPMCCTLLKERPTQRFLKKMGFEANITGLRCCESRVRMFVIAHFGQFYYAKTFKQWRYHPIAFWRSRDLGDDLDLRLSPPLDTVLFLQHFLGDLSAPHAC